MTKDSRFLDLGYLLNNAEDIPKNHGIFGNFDPSTNSRTDVIVADFDTLDDDEDIPKIARDLGFTSVITSQELQDIVQNARTQLSSVDDKNLIKAFLYYIGNDAFIDFESL